MTDRVVEDRVSHRRVEEDADATSWPADRGWLEGRFETIEGRFETIEARMATIERAPRRPRRRVLHLLTGLVAVLAAAAALVAVGAGATAWYMSRDDERTVPIVAGLQLDQAVSRLQDDGFEVDISSRTDATQPEDVVLRQSPAAGTQRDEGTTVAIVVSDGPPPATTP